jgi:outer membrane protein
MNRFMIGCLIVTLMPALAGAQPASGDVLSLDSAIRLALEHNRQLQSARLEVEKAEADLAVARTRRLPSFESEATTAQLLTPVNFAFPQGAFGTFPGTGPIPATNTSVTVPRQPTASVSATLSQPLSQLFQIGLGVRMAATTRDIERTHVRATELSMVNSVKRLYFSILQTASAAAATDEAIALYRELDRTLQVRVAQKVALRADALDVQHRLAEQELSRATYLNTLASQKEQLNQLLGRDVRTPFEVEPVAAIAAFDADLDAMSQRALANRPDVQEARLKLQQAELDRRLTKADRIPEVSLALSYSSNFNIDVLPRNLASVGVKVTWEPFDWGRRQRQLAVKTHSVAQAKLSVRQVEDIVAVEINSRHRTLTERRALLRVAELAQAAAREKLRVKTNHFQIQAALLPDVLQRRAELAASDDRYQQALLAYWTAKADFEQALGEDVIP